MTARRRVAPWLVLAAVVVGGALLQGLPAAPGLERIPTEWFVVLATVSAIVLVAQVCLGAWAVHAIVERSGLGRLPWPLLPWATGAVLVVLAAGVLLPPILPLVLLAALCVLPAAAHGRRNALVGFLVFRWAPWRSVFTAIATIVAIAVSAVVALLAGFFLTGALGGLAMWLWFGAIGVVLLLWWTRLSHRAVRRPTGVTTPRAGDARRAR